MQNIAASWRSLPIRAVFHGEAKLPQRGPRVWTIQVRQDDLSRLCTDAILRRRQNWGHSVRIIFPGLLLKGIGESWVSAPMLLMSCQVVDDRIFVSLILHEDFIVLCRSNESIFDLLLSYHS